MCNVCDCSGGIKSLGVASCPALFDAAYKFVFTPYFKSDGSINETSFAANPALNAAYFAAKIALTLDQPWYPSPEVMNFESERAEAKFESFNNDTVKLFVQNGERTVKGIWVNVPAKIADILNEWNCTQWGFYVITKAGELVGMEGSTYKHLAPIKIQKGSFSSILQQKSNTAIMVQKAMVQFQYDISECDGNLKMIDAPSFATGYDIKQLNGLINVVQKPTTAITATTLSIAADTGQGDIYTPILVEGLVAGDFVISNLTAGTTVAKTLAETSGKYVLTFSAQTAGDYLKVTCTKSGYQFTIYYINAV